MNGPRRRWTLPLVLVTVGITLTACDPPDPTRDQRLTGRYLALLAVEDARPDDQDPGRAVLLDATRSPIASLRAVAVRALGRLEDPALVGAIASSLTDPAPAVRAEAANALAQSVHGGDGDAVVDRLVARVGVERDPDVLAALARSIGRAATSPAKRLTAADALIAIADTAGAPTAQTRVGVALGFESLVRLSGGQGLPGESATLLRTWITSGPMPGTLADQRVRALAYSSLGQARRLDRMLLDRAIADPSPNVRLVAAQNLSAVVPGQRPELIRRLLGDPSVTVSLEAVRRMVAEPRTDLYCRYLLAATGAEAATAIRIVAIDALGRACAESAPQRAALLDAARSLPSGDTDGWRPAAHALVSLSSISAAEARPLLPDFVSHDNPFVRAYAARAATTLRDRDALTRLASDAVGNVRSAAVQGLADLDGHSADPAVIAQLSEDDPFLLITAAGLLEGSREGAVVVDALISAFERISAAERETWRDPRMALLERIEELGDASAADRLRPFVTDYDPVVAVRVAEIVTTWTGQSQTASRRAPPPVPIPTVEEYRALEGTRIVLHMAAGGRIAIDLAPHLATTNVFRFVRLAEDGYFDGLTFHRWAPNFVIQGGSPNANEYQGDGPFTRDEVGLQPHWRGTVGISTRGRDTADGQLFINLIDNVRLDHDYTIVGTVVEGMEIVDGVLEGSVIERAEVVRGG